MFTRRRSEPDLPDDGQVVGKARGDKRTKDLIPRLEPGEIALVYHQDIDRVAAEGLIAAGTAAVVNAASSMSGRYPNLGALLITQAGIPLLDEVGVETLSEISDGAIVTIEGDDLYVDDALHGKGVRQDRETLEQRYEAAKVAVTGELTDFASNTLEYIASEPHLITDRPEMPDLRVDIRRRHVLVVVRGLDYREDMLALRRIGYVNDLKPILIGVDGGADALLENGYTPDIILGDFDSVSQDALRKGAELIVHAYSDGDAPGSARLDRLGFDYKVFEAPGTSEDVALNLAFEKGAELIVLVGSHTSMIDFFDKGREGMASTFLTRMKVAPILVDAKGVSRLYRTTVRKRDLTLLVLSALFTIIVIAAVTEPIRLVLRTLWLNLN
ncbi:MAG: hypothetical protein GY708_19610 [Actinomycetia bacterium]|nr:hypothetical protein [Actinomycetes bacterium]MCP4962964.1 hypothetical protein [Actinomycetes bacterium]